MTYQPLARKYRPSLFKEMVGQDAVAKALANAIALGREPHAVLFTGVRGVGKTTVARLYAKALNCPNRGDGAEPCNACGSCEAITSGRHEDVLEIDGASNTGVGDVRALQETLDYVPQRSRFKIYIIDEVHMLSQAAFNALLKTLEEPPSHVVFVFATTELNRVPQTILSRCQAFYLRKLPNAVIRGRLAEIVGREGVAADDRALTLIAREGHGSMRDALTLLDQAIALGQGKVTAESLGPIVSNLSSSPYLDLVQAMVERDAAKAIAGLAELDQGGAEFAMVAEETANLARHAFVIQGLGTGALDVALLGLDDAEIQRLRDIAARAAPFDLNRIFRTLVKARTELDGSALDRYVLENYVYEWCFDPGFPDLDKLLVGEAAAASSGGAGRAGAVSAPNTPTAAPAAPRTMTSLKGVIGELRAPQATPATSAPAAPQAAAPAQSAAAAAPATPAPQVTAPGVFPPTWRHMVDGWRAKKPLSARRLEEAHAVEYTPTRIILAVSEESFVSKSLLQKDEQVRVREQFKELFGFDGQLIIQPLVKGATAEPNKPVLPETVLTERSREADARRQKVKDDAQAAPFTQDLLRALGGTIEDVRIADVDHS